MLPQDASLHAVLLQRIPEVGPARFSRLIQYFGSAQAALDGMELQWQCCGLQPASIAAMQAVNRDANHRLWQQAKADTELIAGKGIELIAADDSRYPELLRQLACPPPLLYCLGRVELLNQSQIAMVGSRHATAAGRRIAVEMAEGLCQSGYTVTSGLALGIDAAAHQACLQISGDTVAVLGCGVDICYPKRHQVLYQQIREQGLLVSEFPLSTAPGKDNFPRRNRIISGLSLATIVVEAALGSGSLITARYALEQNREVMAVPGSVYNLQSQGCHQLIKQGAALVESSDDIIAGLPGYQPTIPSSNSARVKASPDQLPLLAAEEEIVYRALGFEPVSLDSLQADIGMASGELLANLISLEIKGLISTVGGAYQRR